MEKYKRFYKEISGDEEIQKFLDEVTTNGWQIIFYDEVKEKFAIKITTVCKKSEKLVL